MVAAHQEREEGKTLPWDIDYSLTGNLSSPRELVNDRRLNHNLAYQKCTGECDRLIRLSRKREFTHSD